MPPGARIGYIRGRVAAATRRAGDTVTIHWQTSNGGTKDPVTGALVGATVTGQSLDVKALVHWPDFGKNQVRQYAEIQQGDVIVDFDPSVCLDGKASLRFEIAGTFYAQKDVSEALARSWDVVVRDVKLFRTVLLKRVTA